MTEGKAGSADASPWTPEDVKGVIESIPSKFLL